MSFRILPVGQSAAPIVAALSVAGWRETYAGRVPDDYLAALDRHPKHDVASWRARMGDAGRPSWTYVAERGDGPVGFVHCRACEDLPGYRGEIWRLYVLRRAQGEGIGRALFDAATATLTAQGRAPVMLWVLEFNWGARAFYKKLGGREIARHSFDLAGVPTPEVAYGWPADGTPAVRAP
ncbi:MAG: GNAT family N-acetyltransferase [Alphaproteobacteria bacterium]|nr:GNAT family N-acetyltransferase [Alphaproteobacteria bacterium]